MALTTLTELGAVPTALVILATLAVTYHFLGTTNSKSNKLFPVWATLEIALTTYLLPGHGNGRRILSALRRKDGSLFGLTSRHQLLVDAPQVDRLMAHASSSLSALPVQWTLMTRVFGNPDTPALEKKFYASVRDLNAPVEKLFLNDANATAALERSNIPLKVGDFVTFSEQPEQTAKWERAANVKIVKSDSGVEGVEADLQSLVRDFGACIAIPAFYGHDFLERYPQVLEDLWKFDNDLFPLCMIGMPLWAPFKIVREGVAARKRLHNGLGGLYRRVSQYQKGEDIDFGADMSDISEAAKGRHAGYEKHGWTFEERGVCEIGILWGQNANTQPLLFWLLTYIYSTPNLVEKIREEISPYLTFSSSSPKDLTALDIAGLGKGCQLLKACVFETYRLVNEVTSIRAVSRPITFTEENRTHSLSANSFLSATLSIANHDAAVYDDPSSFNPSRFLDQSATGGKPTARYGKLKPWGSGSAMCKGRTFAEKEIMALGAAIMSMWEIAPVGGKWELPDRVPGTGVQKPVRDVRVIVTRRQW